MKNFFTGLSYNFTAIQYFFSHKQIWKFTIIPIIVNFFLLILLTTLYLNYFDDIFSFISGPLGSMDVENPEGFWSHALDTILWGVRNLFKIVFFILSLVLIFVGIFILSSIINSPFYESMAEKIMVIEGVFDERPFNWKAMIQETLQSLKMEGFKIILFIAIATALWFLSWIPIVGFVFTVIGFFFTSWLFAMGICTFPMIIEHRKFKEILSWALNKKSTLIGFGIPSLIPFLGIMILPMQVIGGTLLYIKGKAND
jgi:uncharacterized protein involved in cysteine biosynthesis